MAVYKTPNPHVWTSGGGGGTSTGTLSAIQTRYDAASGTTEYSVDGGQTWSKMPPAATITIAPNTIVTSGIVNGTYTPAPEYHLLEIQLVGGVMQTIMVDVNRCSANAIFSELTRGWVHAFNDKERLVFPAKDVVALRMTKISLDGE